MEEKIEDLCNECKEKEVVFMVGNLRLCSDCNRCQADEIRKEYPYKIKSFLRDKFKKCNKRIDVITLEGFKVCDNHHNMLKFPWRFK